MKSPYQIESPQWDKNSDTFAYIIKNRVYIRDSISLILLDSFPTNENSDLSAFSNPSRKAYYPLSVVKPDGNSVTIITQKTPSSTVEGKTIINLPASVKAGVLNQAQTHMAFLGMDGNAYVYDLKTLSVVGQMKYYLSTNDIFFTYDNKVLLADSSKTAALYSLTGQKQKTYTTANTISALDLSADGETVVIGDISGSLSFYNTTSNVQIGYAPVLNTKSIKNIKLSYDSSKILVTGRDGTLCATQISEILFAPNTISPKVEQFNFNYSQIDPTKIEEIVTEFNGDEVIVQNPSAETEYITTTTEKLKEKQNFTLEDEIPEPQKIIVLKQPDQESFAPTVIEVPKQEDKTKNLIKEMKPLVTEIPQTKPAVTVTETEEKRNPLVKKEPEKPVVTEVEKRNNSNVAVIDNTPDKTVADAKAPLTIVINNLGNGDGKISGTGSEAEDNKNEEFEPEEAETPAEELKPVKKESKRKAKKAAAEQEPKTEVKTERISLSKDWKRIRTYDDEDIKTLFKDGHGLLINAGAQKIIHVTTKKKLQENNNNKTETYNFYFDIPVGYRNYDLLRPFYFGGTAETSIGLPSENFPYKYYTKSGKLVNPLLFSECIYVPFGLCMYPWKNSLEVYFEAGLGTSISCLWNGNFGKGLKRSSMFPAFYSNVKAGLAWDFMNLSICESYDVIKGFSFGVEFGALINIGGTRTIGSLIKK